MRTLFYATGLLAVSMPLLVSAQQPALLTQSLAIKYMRDSQEYSHARTTGLPGRGTGGSYCSAGPAERLMGCQPRYR